MTISLARWHLLGLSSNAASRVNIGFGCLASLTHESLRLRLLRLSERLEPNRPGPFRAGCAKKAEPRERDDCQSQEAPQGCHRPEGNADVDKAKACRKRLLSRSVRGERGRPANTAQPRRSSPD